jgi:hypothetical protein
VHAGVLVVQPQVLDVHPAGLAGAGWLSL